MPARLDLPVCNPSRVWPLGHTIDDFMCGKAPYHEFVLHSSGDWLSTNDASLP